MYTSNWLARYLYVKRAKSFIITLAKWTQSTHYAIEAHSIVLAKLNACYTQAENCCCEQKLWYVYVFSTVSYFSRIFSFALLISPLSTVLVLHSCSLCVVHSVCVCCVCVWVSDFAFCCSAPEATTWKMPSQIKCRLLSVSFFNTSACVYDYVYIRTHINLYDNEHTATTDCTYIHCWA